MTHWLRFWFSPEAPASLGICRVLFFGFLLIIYLPLDYRVLAEAPAALWFPIGLFRDFGLQLPAADTIGYLQAAWKAGLVLSCIGLATRASTVVSFVLGTLVLGLPNNLGKTNHNDAAVVLVMLVLAASRCGDACSIDSLLLRRRVVKPGGDYRWPVRCVQVLLALVFFGAGLSKLRTGALYWFSGDNVQIMLLQHAVFHEPLTRGGLWIAQYPLLSRLIATTTVFIELTYPLALFSARVRWLLVPASLCMLSGIRVLMGPDFTPLMICSIFWVDWAALLPRSLRPRSETSKPGVL